MGMNSQVHESWKFGWGEGTGERDSGRYPQNQLEITISESERQHDGESAPASETECDTPPGGRSDESGRRWTDRKNLTAAGYSVGMNGKGRWRRRCVRAGGLNGERGQWEGTQGAIRRTSLRLQSLRANKHDGESAPASETECDAPPGGRSDESGRRWMDGKNLSQQGTAWE